jgi:ankyrin repeat protein
MHSAAQNGHLEILKLLLEKAPATAEVQFEDGATPIFIAAQNGHLETVNLLLEKAPATAEVQRKDGWTSMHIAAWSGHLETVKLLLEKAPTTAQLQAKNGMTPRDIAAQRQSIRRPDHKAIVLFLDEHVKGNTCKDRKHKPVIKGV